MIGLSKAYGRLVAEQYEDAAKQEYPHGHTHDAYDDAFGMVAATPYDDAAKQEYPHGIGGFVNIMEDAFPSSYLDEADTPETLLDHSQMRELPSWLRPD